MKYRHISPELVKDIQDLAKAKKPSDLKRFTAVKVETFASPDEVRKARKKLGLSQKGFAEVFGLSKKTIQSWEQSFRFPDVVASKLIRLMLKRPGFAKELKAA